MIENLYTYLPQDRLRALAYGQFLPDRTHGTALFADISGFTALTEQLRHTLGSRRGIEALTSQINAVYTALIAEIERYHGSVISFAGDAVMCWFDDVDEKGEQPTAVCAVACALAMQTAMRHFPDLGLKVAIATGSARRLVVGDPQIHCLDTLAGEAVSRTATAEHLAQKGEVLADEATVNLLDTAVSIAAWRADPETGERFALLTHLATPVALAPLPDPPDLEPTQLQAWLHQLVYEREMAGQGSFLTEFRPCVVLFVRFVGIDYDSDKATAQLDTFVQQVQQITARYGGVLLQLTNGDKGNYAYINFGALQTYEDNSRRALKAALALREVSPLAIQIGIAQGVMRVGTYGGATRRTYGALGDDVNLAARLMSQAATGEILVSQQVQTATATDFVFVAHTAVRFKGKTDPVPFFALINQQKRHAIRLQEPDYALPMVGRQAELQQITAKLQQATQGQNQVIGIIADAGLGKSRLVAEAIRIAHQQGFVGYGGACQSDAISTPYHPWKSIWQAFFGLAPETPLPQLRAHLEQELQQHAPQRIPAMPLLNVLLETDIPENDFTQKLEPKARQSTLHALLEDCLKSAAQTAPLLIVIEDMHWIDALSHDLLEQLAKATSNRPICFILAYRPPQLERLVAPRLESLPQFTRIELSLLTTNEAEQAIQAKIAQLYPNWNNTLSADIAARLMTRAQGNPFYLEELLNYVHDHALDPADIGQITLPDSLYTLILSRIDRLSEEERVTLRVASIIGRMFRVDWLIGLYPELGTLPHVKASLERLHRLDITPLESTEPELVYLFKHIVTHEVTYESLPFVTRARLHEQLAAYLEQTYQHMLPLEALAFHYGCSANKPKQIHYLRRAGEAAQKNFANEAALDFYGALLPLLPDNGEKIDIYLQRGAVLELMGQWAEAENDYRAALALTVANRQKQGEVQFALGKLCGLRGEYDVALNWFAQAQETQLAFDDDAGLIKTMIERGTVIWRQGNYEEARHWLNKGLTQAEELGDVVRVALALNNLGNIAYWQGDYALAQTLLQESLHQRRAIGGKQDIAASLNNLGNVAADLGDYAGSWTLFDECLGICREIGHKLGIAVSLNNLGNVARDRGDYATARALYEESVDLCWEMGDKHGVATSLNNLGIVASNYGDYERAHALYEEGLALQQEIGDSGGIALSLTSLGMVAYAQGRYERANSLLEEGLSLRREMSDKWGIANSLNNLGMVACAQGVYDRAHTLLEEGLALRREIGDKGGIADSLNCRGYLALLLGDGDGAQVLFAESLGLADEVGLKPKILWNLVGMAGVAGEQKNHGRALHLAAAAEALRVEMGIHWPSLPQQIYEQVIATTRAALGQEAFAAGWAAGQALTLAEAVALAS